jgi:hypothetical protein
MAFGTQRDARRSARVEAKFLLALEGVDAELVRRKGDISATGLYFEFDEGIGEVGTVHYLRLASLDRARSLRIMAHVVRKVSLTGTGSVMVNGAALEFMPESEAAARAVEEFVHYILTLTGEQPESLPHVGARLPAEARAGAVGDPSAVVRQLSVRSMTIETNWQVLPGEQVRVEIAAPGLKRRVCLEGAAIRVEPKKTGGSSPPFHVEVEFQAEIQRPRRMSSTTFTAVRPEVIAAARSDGDEEVSRTLDDLFSAIIRPVDDDARKPTQHLSGLISRIRLPTLCSLFEMEGISGELTLRRSEETVVVYVSNGRLIDVAPLPSGVTPRQHLGTIFAWEDGSFEFDVKVIERADKIGVGTTALILDLARQFDEAQAGIELPPGDTL